jgi:hypothetical protein
MPSVSEFDPFARLLQVLEPWLDEVGIVGGWAHRLHRLHPLAQPLSYAPLMTLDADVALPSRLPIQDEHIRQRLLAGGFREEFLGTNQPPATHYRLGTEGSGFYAEFITPLVGSAYDRRSRRKATLEIAGVPSHQLRYVDLLLYRPWTVEVRERLFSGAVKVANHASFIARKILIQGKRPSADRAKDIPYVHDTLQLFDSRLAEPKQEWATSVLQRLQTRQRISLTGAPQSIFGEVTDDIRRAARIAGPRVPSPEAIREACPYGLDQLML